MNNTGVILPYNPTQGLMTDRKNINTTSGLNQSGFKSMTDIILVNIHVVL